MSNELEARLRRNEPRRGENASGLRNEAADTLQRYREALEKITAPMGNAPDRGDKGWSPGMTTEHWHCAAVSFRRIARQALQERQS
ncbi:hypothetical protein [Aurantiacibacter spongiae]|uniref:Uncharacterized protein n=1 Tax=Aurantiacibacter spongiae TaxID=2488860 RepID=A0A3N5DIG6_9SPHN|nr:hypothetical protein [Aurantiacibacter spongiae]RPF70425.1 hypothetical protein EG799_01375 [Aurantiacibacter spongiae]